MIKNICSYGKIIRRFESNNRLIDIFEIFNIYQYYILNVLKYKIIILLNKF